jgi:lipopolysaccharide transport system ATP-binding protein
MVSISLKNVSVHYPVFSSSKDISIKNKVFKKLIGGHLFAHENTGSKYIKALSNINLTINSGDRVGLTGLNGSGKSTLLKVFSGALEPTIGKVTTTGKISSMIEFSMGLDGELTAIENILLRAGLKNMKKNETENFIFDVINFSDLQEFKNIQVCQYSSGMQLRLAYSMATYQSADILIMDEIVFVGDEDFTKKIKKNLDVLIDKSKILIIASHNHELLKSYCNKFINLKKGSITENQ